MRTSLLALLLLLSSTRAFAGPNPNDYVRYLLPVTTQAVHGAFGSLWVGELSLFAADGPVSVIGPLCSPPPPLADCFGLKELPANQLVRASAIPRESGVNGAFAYIEKKFAPFVDMTLRVHDTSRDALSFGTEIPIVNSDEFRYVLNLLDVPTDPRFRATLRIYSDSAAPHRVRVRVFAGNSTVPIEEGMVDLSGIVNVAPEPFPPHPAYAQVDPLSDRVRAAGQRVRIEVDVPDFQIISPPPFTIWGFVSVTNNDTQHVTTITPLR